jgi:hypothetical protein
MCRIEDSLISALASFVNSGGSVFFAWEDPVTAQCTAYASTFFLPHFPEAEQIWHGMLRRVMVGTNADDDVSILHHLLCPLPRARTVPEGPPSSRGRTHGPYGQWLQAPAGYFYNTYPRLRTSKQGCSVEREIATSAHLPRVCHDEVQSLQGQFQRVLPPPTAAHEAEEGADGGAGKDLKRDFFDKHEGMADDFATFLQYLRLHVEARTQMMKKHRTKGKVIRVWFREGADGGGRSTSLWRLDFKPLQLFLRKQNWRPQKRTWRTFLQLTQLAGQCERKGDYLEVSEDVYEDVKVSAD